MKPARYPRSTWWHLSRTERREIREWMRWVIAAGLFVVWDSIATYAAKTEAP